MDRAEVVALIREEMQRSRRAVRSGASAAALAYAGAKYGIAIPPNANWTSSATYSKIGRLVVLQGFFSKTGGTGTPVANDAMGTLPAEACPSVQLNPPALTQNGDIVGSIIIQTNGVLLWRVGSTAEVDQTHVDGLAYIV